MVIILKIYTVVKQKKGKRPYNMKLGPNITLADLKTKVSKANEASKKTKTIKVYMSVTDENEEPGKNIFATVSKLLNLIETIKCGDSLKICLKISYTLLAILKKFIMKLKGWKKMMMLVKLKQS